MELVRLPRRPADWDRLIESYATKTLFHESVWLDYITRFIPKGRVDYYEIHHRGQRVGYYCPLRVNKILLPVYGSPLPGTALYLGPVVNHDIPQRELVDVLLDLCRRQHIAHLELAHEWLHPNTMEQLGFSRISITNHLCPLPATEEAAWWSLRGTGRNRIRRAQNNGLVAEMTDDPAIVDHFYEQFLSVLLKKKASLPYDISRPRLLFRHLFPAGRLFPVWVKYRGEVIAAGLFPHDNRCVYYWDAAWVPGFEKLHPNELLHWTVIKLAVAARIPMYDMYGGTNVFKRKFGGHDVQHHRYRIALTPLILIGAQVRDYLETSKDKLARAVTNPPRARLEEPK